MSQDLPPFELTDIRWIYTPSGQGQGRIPEPPTRTGMTSASVKCNKCNKQWRTIEGEQPGQFRYDVGGVSIICRGCGADALVPLPA